MDKKEKAKREKYLENNTTAGAFEKLSEAWAAFGLSVKEAVEAMARGFGFTNPREDEDGPGPYGSTKRRR